MIRFPVDVFSAASRLMTGVGIALMCLLMGCGDDASNSRYGKISATPVAERAMLPNGAEAVDGAADAACDEDDGHDYISGLCGFMWRAEDVGETRAPFRQADFMTYCYADIEEMIQDAPACAAAVRTVDTCLRRIEAAAMAKDPDKTPVVRLAACKNGLTRMLQACGLPLVP